MKTIFSDRSIFIAVATSSCALLIALATVFSNPAGFYNAAAAVTSTAPAVNPSAPTGGAFTTGMDIPLAWYTKNTPPGSLMQLSMVRMPDVVKIADIATVSPTSSPYTYTVPDTLPDGNYKVYFDLVSEIGEVYATAFSGLLIKYTGAPGACQVSTTYIANGATKNYYSTKTVPTGISCENFKQTRSCTDGILTGSNTYRYDTCAVSATATCSVLGEAMNVKTTDFSTDPQWTGTMNRMPPVCYQVKQNFGYNSTLKAAGGTFTNSYRLPHVNQLATYAQVMSQGDGYGWSTPLTVTGKIKMPSHQGGNATLGFFSRNTSSNRPRDSIGINFDYSGESRISATNHNFEGSAALFDTSALNDKQYHNFYLSYDPSIPAVIASIDGKATSTLLFEGTNFSHVNDTEIRLHRFGFANMGTSGDAPRKMEMYIDDVYTSWNDKLYTFDSVPTDWDSYGSNAGYTDCRTRPNQNYGWANGEVGGVMWRWSEQLGKSYYADSVNVDYSMPFCASGTVRFDSGVVDSGMYMGYFDESMAYTGVPNLPKEPVAGFFGTAVEGPTRFGHFFYVSMSTTTWYKPNQESAPPIRPTSSTQTWLWTHDPITKKATLKLGSKSYEVPVLDDQYTAGIHFDRFGLIPLRPDGSSVEVYFDNMSYVTGKK